MRFSFLNLRNWFRGRLKEASAADLFGTPVSDYELNFWNGRPLTGPGPIFNPELYRDKLQTVRTLQELNRLRHISRVLYERNPNAAGGINGMGRYVVGCGSAQEVQSTDPDSEPPKRLAKAITELLDEFKKACQWKIVEREIYRRYLTDGECFIQLTPMDDGVTALKFIEPDAIVPPANQSFEGPWSWGILTDPDRPGTPLKYNVRDYTTNTEQQVPAVFVFHLKRGSNLNQKRGLPALTSCIDDLQGGQKLRHASREGEKVRASIAYVRQHAQAPVGAIQALQSASATGSYTEPTPNGSREVVYQKVEPGSVQDIPEGLEYVAPPESPNSEAAAMSVRLSLEATAAALEAPYWLISGDSSASSYASSLTAESPFIKLVEAEQDVVGEYVDSILTAVIEIASEQERDNIPTDVLEKIDLHVNYTVPVVRQKLDEAQRNEILRNARIKSPQTISAEEGLDYDKEQANFAALPPEVMPGESATDAAGQPKTASGQMKREQEAVAVGGRSRLQEGVWDESKHPRDHGKFSSSPGGSGDDHDETHSAWEREDSQTESHRERERDQRDRQHDRSRHAAKEKAVEQRKRAHGKEDEKLVTARQRRDEKTDAQREREDDRLETQRGKAREKARAPFERNREREADKIDAAHQAELVTSPDDKEALGAKYQAMHDQNFDRWEEAAEEAEKALEPGFAKEDAEIEQRRGEEDDARAAQDDAEDTEIDRRRESEEAAFEAQWDDDTEQQRDALHAPHEAKYADEDRNNSDARKKQNPGAHASYYAD